MKKRFISLLLAFAMITGVLTGCSSTSNAGSSASATQKDKSEKVNLVMYLVRSQQPDDEKVFAALNEKLQADLNCTLTIKSIDYGEYATKYPLVLASGEQIDLIYTSSWLNYPALAKKGAFMAIEDTLKKNAPLSYSESDINTLTSSSDDGHIYCLPANHASTTSVGVITRGDVMEKLGITKMDTLDDYFNFVIKAKDMGYRDSSYASHHNIDEFYLASKGYYQIIGGYWVNLKDSNLTVYEKSEIPELQEYLQKAQELCNNGAWSQNALTNSDTQMLQEGLSAGVLHNVGLWEQVAVEHPEYELEYHNLSNPIYEGTLFQDCMAIPVSAKYPEKALQVLELLRQDESYYNLLTYGIEGEHYKIDEKTGYIELLNQTKYVAENGTWGFRNDKFYREPMGSPENAVELKKEINKQAQSNILKAFIPNTDSIKNEFAAVQNAETQYYDPLQLGYVDYKSGLENLTSALNVAGNAKCKEELQKQITEYAAKMKN